jgi:hypothetical protein
VTPFGAVTFAVTEASELAGRRLARPAEGFAVLLLPPPDKSSKVRGSPGNIKKPLSQRSRAFFLSADVPRDPDKSEITLQ